MKIYSPVIKSFLSDEYERTERMLMKYNQEISLLPKGSLLIRNIGNKKYAYLNYRKDSKPVSEFIGNAEVSAVFDLQERINKRKRLASLIKELVIEQKDLQKILKKNKLQYSIM